MLFRLIGRLYFWLVLVPHIHRWVTPVLCDIVADAMDKKIEDLPQESKARLEKARNRRRHCES